MNANQKIESTLIGEFLVSQGLVSAQDIDQALRVQQKVGGRIGQLLMRAGAISEDVLLDCLSTQLQMPILGKTGKEPSLSDIQLNAETHGLNMDWMFDQQVVVWADQDRLCYTAQDVLSTSILEALSVMLPDSTPVAHLSTSQSLGRLLSYVRSSTLSQQDDNLQRLIEMAEDGPTVELVNNIMAQAGDLNASDVHVEPEQDAFKVRFRVDGVLRTQHNLPSDRFNALVSRVKLISNIDIAERRLPQDGRFSTRVGGKDYEIRVSTLPGVDGESLVMRLLPKEREEMQLDRLGMRVDHMDLMKRWMRQPHGIVLVTGPTGSGKSSTLYAAIDDSNDGVRKIITVEDPVEFKLPGVTQVQTHAEIGLTFASALRSILRQDPDVVMVGEIRDLETAEMAIQASLTGHLVLSTMHTNDAVSAFVRLTDMGIEPFLVATPIVGVQAQRLVRRVCQACSIADEQPTISADLRDRLDDMASAGEASDWRLPQGCSVCSHTGYKGRLGIYELIPVTEQLQEMILAGKSLDDMRRSLALKGTRFMKEDGLLKARAGMTTIDEVLRVTSFQE